MDFILRPSSIEFNNLHKMGFEMHHNLRALYYQNSVTTLFFIYFVVVFLFVPFIALSDSIDTLNVTIDMRTPLEEGWFDPTLESVGLRGDRHPLSWGTTVKAVDSDNDGLYHASLPFLLEKDSLIIELKIKVDGVGNPNDGWQIGRNHVVTIHRNKPNNVLMAWDDEAPPPQSTISGHIDIINNFESGELLPRDIYVYLPPDYVKSDNHYPVLYMHDGQNLFDASAAGQEWGLDEAAESLIRSGQLQPLIIVGIGNTKNRIDEYTPTRQVWHHVLQRQSPPQTEGTAAKLTGTFVTETGDSVHFSARADTLFAMIPGSLVWQKLVAKSDSVFYLPQAGMTFQFQIRNSTVDRIIADKPTMGGDGDVYGNFLINTVKPFIDRHYRTKPEMAWTALGGSSLGGLITLHIGLKHSETFGHLLVLSPSVWWDNRQILQTVQTLEAATDQRILLYVGTGESEQTVENVRTLKNLLLEKGWTKSQIESVEAPNAGHNERAWAEQANRLLLFLYQSE